MLIADVLLSAKYSVLGMFVKKLQKDVFTAWGGCLTLWGQDAAVSVTGDAYYTVLKGGGRVYEGNELNQFVSTISLR